MQQVIISEEVSQPFLRWAGGKTWLLKHIDTTIPVRKFNNYHEPFLGGGSLFFHLKPINTCYLSDLNEELIQTYKAVRDDVEGVIKELRKFNNTEEDYYLIRESKFRSTNKRAAKFIYLNQTSFNGIYRVNLQGEYNVPYGYREKDFFQPDVLRQCSKDLQKCWLSHGDFTRVKRNIGKGDLVFLDPPYTVSHNDNGFIKYNQKLFSLDDQHRLSRLIDFIKARKAYYILTNAAHKEVRKIFEKGDKSYLLKRASVVGGALATRQLYSEIIFTNLIKK